MCSVSGPTVEVSLAIDTFLYEHGIVHETSTPDTSAQNGRVERLMCNIMTIMQSLLSCVNLSNGVWAYPAMHALDLNNWSMSAHAAVMPVASFYGRAVALVNMKPFGCSAWVLLPHQTLMPPD